MDMVELVRRWQAGESVRGIARQTRGKKVMKVN
jgi:hypothetical protein